jgi:hypothetical protein
MAALTFPLSVASFFGKLRVQDVRFQDVEPQQVDRTANGTVLKASLGEPVWRGTVRLANDANFHRGAETEALLSLASRAGASFLIYDPRKSFPKLDPTGSILGATVPSLSAIDADRRRLSLSGLPSGYTMSPGDLLGWQYGSSPVRYAYHRIVVGAVANGSGNTGLMEVTPTIPVAATAGAAVSLIRPVMKAVMQPDPDYGGGGRRGVLGASFGFSQTLR